MSTSASSSEASADSTTVKLKGISPVSSIPNSSSLRIGIVHTQWNKEIISALVNGAIHELERQGVPQTSIHVLSVRITTSSKEQRIRYSSGYYILFISMNCIFSFCVLSVRTNQQCMYVNSFVIFYHGYF